VNVFSVLILVCAAALARQECRIETARAVIQGPDANNEVMCAFHGQAYLAGTQIGRDLRPGQEYVKVLCRRTTIGPSIG